MNRRRFMSLTLGLLLFAVTPRYASPAGQRPADKTEGPISLSGVSSPHGLAVRIRTLLSSASTTELHRLATVPDCDVALAAAWERVCRTVPAAQQEELVNPDRDAISRFLGLLEGRIQFSIPEEWEASVKSAKVFRRREFLFSCPERGEQPFPGHGLLRRAGHQWIVKKDGKLITLPADKGSAPVDFAAVEFADKRAFTALYGWPPAPYKLFATDLESGEVIWSSSVWAAGDWIGYSGWGWHFVAIRSAGDKLAIFGMDSRTLYVEVFDKNTGANRCRFGTAYADENGPRR